MKGGAGGEDVINQEDVSVSGIPLSLTVLAGMTILASLTFQTGMTFRHGSPIRPDIDLLQE